MVDRRSDGAVQFGRPVAPPQFDAADMRPVAADECRKLVSGEPARYARKPEREPRHRPKLFLDFYIRMPYAFSKAWCRRGLPHLGINYSTACVSLHERGRRGARGARHI
jgi:hypothetical protein